MNIALLNPSVLAPYTGMVIELEKNPLTLLEEWRAQPERVSLVHGQMGMGGEIGEVIEALLQHDIKGLLKELGDLCFYARLATTGAKALAARHQLFPAEEYQPTFCLKQFAGNTMVMLPIITGNAIDSIKKLTFYNQEVTAERVERVLQDLANTMFAAFAIGACFGFSADDILAANARKLKGIDLLAPEAARYAEGYSDKAAGTRADEGPAVVPFPEAMRPAVVDPALLALYEILHTLPGFRMIERLSPVHPDQNPDGLFAYDHPSDTKFCMLDFFLKEGYEPDRAMDNAKAIMANLWQKHEEENPGEKGLRLVGETEPEDSAAK